MPVVARDEPIRKKLVSSLAGVSPYSIHRSMPKRRFTHQELVRSAAAGEPRLDSDFDGDTDAYHAYQDQWFATFKDEALPPVRDANRTKRWKAARRQRKAIEEHRAWLLVRSDDSFPTTAAKNERQQQVTTERQRERRECEREDRLDDTENKIRAALHDASGSTITANSRRLAGLRERAEAIQERDRRLDAQEFAYAQVLVGAGAASSVADADNRFFDAAHILGLFHAGEYKTPGEFVNSLLTQGDCYVEFLEQLQGAVRLPRYLVQGADTNEDLVTDFARLGWTKAQLEGGGIIVSDYLDPKYARCDHVAYIHGFRMRASRNVFQSEVPVSEIEEGIFEPLWAVGDVHLDDDHRNGGRTADGLRELRNYVCVLPSDARATAVDAPGLDIGVAKDINEACYRWLQNAGLVERDDGGTDVGELQQAEAEEEEDITMSEDITMF